MDDAVCVQRLSDGALFIATQGSLFRNSSGSTECTDQERATVEFRTRLNAVVRHMVIEERSFHTGQIALNVAEIAHAGAPGLMLLHGGSARWQYLENVMNDLSSDYQIIAPDLRGHGLSENTPDAYRLVDFAEDIQRLIRSIGRPVALFGHSLGGNVAQMVAAKIPDRVSALVIGDSPIVPIGQKPLSAHHQRMVRQWAKMAGKAKEVVVDQLKAMLISPEDGAPERPALEVLGEDSPWFSDMAECLVNHDPTFPLWVVEKSDQVLYGFVAEDLLPAITCPTLLLQADPERGGMMTDRQVELAKRYVPKLSHVRLSGIGHGLFVEDPKTVINVLREFLTESLSR